MSNSSIVANVTATNKGEIYTTYLRSSDHTAIADEPKEIGGRDEGPAPADYLCMALASCKAITLRMYVERKKWNIQNIEVRVSLQKLEVDNAVSHIFHATIHIDDFVSEEQKQRLIYIAKACPVSKLLSKENKIETMVAK